MKTQNIFYLFLIALLAGCAGMHESKDYQRHTLSTLAPPLDGGDYYWFDVSITADMPEKSETAEATRMEWLVAWLETKKLCRNGHTVVERRPFEFLEHNPANYDLRYKVRCNS